MKGEQISSFYLNSIRIFSNWIRKGEPPQSQAIHNKILTFKAYQYKFNYLYIPHMIISVLPSIDIHKHIAITCIHKHLNLKIKS
jgi:hypothetical protein